MKLSFYTALTILITGVFLSSAYANVDIGIGARYGYRVAFESGEDASSSSYYYQENDASQQYVIGITMFLYPVFDLGRNVLLSFGPFLDMGGLILRDDYPAGLSASGVFALRFGVDMKIQFASKSIVRPYLKMSAGLYAGYVDWETTYSTSVFPSGLNYREQYFGPSYGVGLGLSFRLTKLVGVYFEAGYEGGLYSTDIVRNDTAVIPEGNSCQYNGLAVTLGLVFAVKYKK